MLLYVLNDSMFRGVFSFSAYIIKYKNQYRIQNLTCPILVA